MNLFKKKKYVSIPVSTKEELEDGPIIKDGMWRKCLKCGKMVYAKELGALGICPFCDGHFRLNAFERVSVTADKGSYVQLFKGIQSKNPMNYPGYEEKIQAISKETCLDDAVLTGECTIGGIQAVLCMMDSNFIMGSMGSVVGEKITLAFEYAIKNRLPVVIFTASGGARMQEGILSLMQMAKVSQAAARHSQAGLLYVSVLTDPTTGGVTASFAMLGDIILAEPGALIGFAGARVIEGTINQKLPEGFQSAEFLLEHGFVDKIVHRQEMANILAKILKLHAGGDKNECR